MYSIHNAQGKYSINVNYCYVVIVKIQVPRLLLLEAITW